MYLLFSADLLVTPLSVYSVVATYARSFLSKLSKLPRRILESSQVKTVLLRKRFSCGILANTIRSFCFFSAAALRFSALDIAVDLVICFVAAH